MRANVAASACIVIMTAGGLVLKCVDTFANHRTSIAAQTNALTNRETAFIDNRLKVDRYCRETGTSEQRAYYLTGIDLSKPAVPPSASYQSSLSLPDLDYGTTDVPVTIGPKSTSITFKPANALNTPTTPHITGGEFTAKVPPVVEQKPVTK